MLRLSAFIAIGLLTALPVYAQPQVPCMDKAQMHIKLKQQYGETTVVRGITSSSMMFELLLNPETETWTILLNSPANISCLVGQGTGIEFLAEAPCYRRSKDVKSNRGYKSTSFDQTSYRQMCAQGSSHIATARARSGDPPLPR
jgi:hypothetical protein